MAALEEKEMSEVTIVLGASLNPDRTSNMAVRRLIKKGYEVIPVGIHHGNIDGVPMVQELPEIENVNTITIYLRGDKQSEYADQILRMKPRRLIFNPGAENPHFYMKARAAGIDAMNACTLVMLSIGSY